MARCPECRQEVVLAKVCPYCGGTVPQSAGRADRAHADRQEGGPGATHKGYRKSHGGARSAHEYRSRAPWQWAILFLQYIRDPYVPRLRKLSIALMAFYIIWPFDILPDYLPIIGWLDDIGVAALLYNFLHSELGIYDQTRRSRR